MKSTKAEHVSFPFDTIYLGSLIVCGLPALPHDLVYKSDARRRLLRVPRYTGYDPRSSLLDAVKMYVTFATTVEECVDTLVNYSVEDLKTHNQLDSRVCGFGKK